MQAALRRGEVWVALGVTAFGVFLLYQTSEIHVASNYARVGPRVFPWVISSVLVLLGLGLLRAALTYRWQGETDVEDLPPVDLGALSWLLIGLVAYLATITAAGFPIATAILFVCAARGFSSRRPSLDLAIGLAVGIVVYVGFHIGLGLTLPGGPLERLIG